MRARAFAAVGRQMLSLASAASPTKLDAIKRQEAVSRVLSAVRRVYADGTVEIFGSAATNLSLPGSDLDLAVMPHGPPPDERSDSSVRRRPNGSTHGSHQPTVPANPVVLLKERLDRLGRPKVERFFLEDRTNPAQILYSCTACLEQYGGPTAVSDNHTKKRSAERQACERLLKMLDDELPAAITKAASRRRAARSHASALAPLVPHIRRLSVGRRLLYLAHARVPIISFVERRSGVRIDLSAERNGVHNSAAVRSSLARHAELRPLLLVRRRPMRSHSRLRPHATPSHPSPRRHPPPPRQVLKVLLRQRQVDPSLPNQPAPPSPAPPTPSPHPRPWAPPGGRARARGRARPEAEALPAQVDKTLHGGVGSYLLFHMALALVEQVSGGATATGSARASPRIRTKGALG